MFLNNAYKGVQDNIAALGGISDAFSLANGSKATLQDALAERLGVVTLENTTRA
jgi:hypothetical protein